MAPLPSSCGKVERLGFLPLLKDEKVSSRSESKASTIWKVIKKEIVFVGSERLFGWDIPFKVYDVKTPLYLKEVS